VVAATAGLVLAGTVAATSASAGSTGTSGQLGTIGTISRIASTSSFPTSTKHTNAGAISLSEDGALQRYVNRSNSPRPQTTRNANGNVVLRAAQAQGGARWLPSVRPTPISSTRPGAVKGWQGLNEYDNAVYAGFSLEPPDQGLCAGNGYVLEMINDVTRVYTTGGATLKTAYLNDFFKEPGYQFTTDPSCVYDAGTGRFYAVQLTLAVDKKTGHLTGKNWLDLAVSKSGNPTGGYNIYRLYVTDDGTNGTPSHKDCPCIGDYPHLATDAHGVYLTTNEYPFSGGGKFGNNFNGAQVYALSKKAAAAGATSLKVVHFQNVSKPTGSVKPRRVGFTLWPAQSAGTAYDTAHNGTINFVSSLAAEEARPDDFTGHAYNLAFWWISNTASLDSRPNLRLMSKSLNVGSYGLPPLSEQKIGPTPLKDCLNVGCRTGINDQYAPEEEGGLDSSDTRVLTAYYANGQVYSALDTAMSVSANVHAGFEWFAITAGGRNSALAGSGYVGVQNNDVSYPAIATNPSGRGYVGMTLSGRGYYPSAAYMTWNKGAGPAVSVAGLGKAPEDGFCEYVFFNCGGASDDVKTIRPRWGDYGYAAWDGTQFYVANEYIAQSCNFSTFNSDTTCGGTRTFYGNFSTHVQVLH
jgi:hypothetical protein